MHDKQRLQVVALEGVIQRLEARIAEKETQLAGAKERIKYLEELRRDGV